MQIPWSCEHTLIVQRSAGQSRWPVWGTKVFLALIIVLLYSVPLMMSRWWNTRGVHRSGNVHSNYDEFFSCFLIISSCVVVRLLTQCLFIALMNIHRATCQ